ncbi:glycosyltransferase family 4 protein [Roseibium salinum]|nr:glycosyltransferase family 4 protein [Roseibium salinum]
MRRVTRWRRRRSGSFPRPACRNGTAASGRFFLGRLDRQKGIERIFFAAARTLQRRGVQLDWRIIGSDVMDSGAGGSWKERFEEIGIQVEPPVYDSRRLSKLMAWADVFVLPSRWEGAPLTIIEAQRLGCVPVATNVGGPSRNSSSTVWTAFC